MKNSGPTDNHSTQNVTKQCVEDTVQEALTEQRLRDEKKKNIMLFGLRESSKPMNEKEADDISNVNKIIKDIKGDDAVRVDRLVRAGRYEQNEENNSNDDNANVRPRAGPIKLFMPDMDSKSRVLNVLRLMIDNDRQGRFKYMYCQPDLTIKQRIEAKKRYQARSQMNREHSISKHISSNSSCFQLLVNDSSFIFCSNLENFLHQGNSERITSHTM